MYKAHQVLGLPVSLQVSRGGSMRKVPTFLKSGNTARVLTLCAAMFLVCLSAFSQGSSTGRLLGTVTDQSGGTVSGATVTITDTQRGRSRVLTADDAGAYNAPELTPGIYTVKAEFRGFRATERQNVNVEVGSEYRIDLTLQP